MSERRVLSSLVDHDTAAGICEHGFPSGEIWTHALPNGLRSGALPKLTYKDVDARYLASCIARCFLGEQT